MLYIFFLVCGNPIYFLGSPVFFLEIGLVPGLGLAPGLATVQVYLSGILCRI